MVAFRLTSAWLAGVVVVMSDGVPYSTAFCWGQSATLPDLSVTPGAYLNGVNASTFERCAGITNR